jgi:hypothetical protein
LKVFGQCLWWGVSLLLWRTSGSENKLELSQFFCY